MSTVLLVFVTCTVLLAGCVIHPDDEVKTSLRNVDF
jgi:hypothetical protein